MEIPSNSSTLWDITSKDEIIDNKESPLMIFDLEMLSFKKI